VKYRYRITVTFTASRQLKPGELSDLVNACAIQVEDPYTVDGEGELSSADFSTTVDASGARLGQ